MNIMFLQDILVDVNNEKIIIVYVKKETKYDSKFIF